MIIEEGKFYRTRRGDKIGPMRKPHTDEDWIEGVEFVCDASGWFPAGKYRMGVDDPKDLVAEWVEPGDLIYSEGDTMPIASASLLATLEHIDLVTAYRDGPLITLNVTVGGKAQKFTISKTTAASMIGRVAEAICS